MGARYILFLFGTAGVLLTTGLTYPYVMDDALITLRYSENLAASGLPIWNKADVANPTMGYTSPTWMVLNSIPALFTDNRDTLVQVTKAYSIAAVLFFLALVSNWVVRSGYTLGRGLFLVFLLFWNPIIGLHINSGMETIFFSVLVFVFAYQILHQKNYFLILATGFLCYLTRPEAGLIVLTFWALDFATNRNVRKSMLGAAALGILLVGYHFLVAWFYGDALPTPFYVKQASGSLFKVAALKDTAIFLVFSALPYLIITVAGIRADWARLKVILAFPVVLFLFFLTVTPYMNVAYRYQLPIVFLLYLTTVIACRGFARLGMKTQVLTYLLVGLQWVFNLGVADMYAKKTGRAAVNLELIGRALREKNDYTAWMAYGDAGLVCYYSDFNTIDLNGLNTKEIARGLLTKEDALRDPKVRLLLANAEFGSSDEVRPGLDVRDLGLLYVGSVPVTRDSKKTVVVQCYARDAFIDSTDVAWVQTDPDYESSWFESLYYAGRKMVKNR